jgi:hypothetical protein|tara:strand:- start:321 stop:488 length:168 start_codon:yes stop_codon:yes gene_type:complete
MKNKLGLWIGLGITFGSLTGLVLGNSGLGISIGLCLGVAIGNYLDRKDKKEENSK